jgi:hypothetical protein
LKNQAAIDRCLRFRERFAPHHAAIAFIMEKPPAI